MPQALTQTPYDVHPRDPILLDLPPSHDEKDARAYGVRKRAERIKLKNAFADAFAEAGLEPQAKALRDCSEAEVLAICPDCMSPRYVPTRCRSRVCPICSFNEARARADYITRRTVDCPHPKLITLTMPAWRTDPRDGIRHLKQAFGRLRRLALWRAVRGGAYTIELVQHEGYWHIHMHIIADADYLPYQKLFSAWRTVLATRTVQIDVRSASDDKARRYVAKYASKDSMDWLSRDNIVAWWTAVRGRRLWATFGSWFSDKLPDLHSDPEHRPTPSLCQHCGSERPAIPIAASPYYFGHELWPHIQAAIAGLPLSRPLSGAPPRPVFN